MTVTVTTENEKLPTTTRKETSESDDQGDSNSDDERPPPLSNNSGTPTSSTAAIAEVTVAQTQDEHVTDGTCSNGRGAHSGINEIGSDWRKEDTPHTRTQNHVPSRVIENPVSSQQNVAAVEEISGSDNDHNSMHSAEERGGDIERAPNSDTINNASMHRSVAEDIRPGAFRVFPNGPPTAPSPEAIAFSSDSGVMDAESRALEDGTNRHIDVTAEAYAVEELGGMSNAIIVPTILGVEKKRFYLMAAIVVVLLAITLGTILGTFIPTINDDDGSAADQTRKPKPPTIILTPEELATKRQILVIALSPLAGQEVFDLDKSANSSAHRNQALEWLMNDIPDYASPTTESIFGYYQEWKIQQRYIMALIYFGTNGTGWIHQLEFLSELDECQWMLRTSPKIDYKNIDYLIPGVPKGLACNSIGEIMRIDFKMNNLVGTIPHEVSFLSKSLKTFVLNSNKLLSTIPSSFEELKKLTVMMLHDNCLTGTIPENLHKMKSLEKVELWGNSKLSGNLNGFCDEDGGLRGNMFLTTNCVNCLWVEGGEWLIKCDCCGCCDGASSICCSAEGVPSFITALGPTFDFDESKCKYAQND